MTQRRVWRVVFAVAFLMSIPALAQNPFFTQGNLVVAVEGCGVHGGTCTNVLNGTGTGAGNSTVGGYGDNQAAPLTLFQYTPSGTSSVSFLNSMVLPQTASGANVAMSGEYGSSSEGTLHLSGTGQYLALMGYGVNDAAFNANPATYGIAGGELGQSVSLTGQSGITPVPRVLTLIDANGNVNSAAAIYNIFNGNNPRSGFTFDGTTGYISGQGTSGDATGGVFYVPMGASSAAPTSITGADAGGGASQDTRDVQIYNNTLYVSMDSKSGSYNRSYVGTLGTPPSTSVYSCGSGCPTGAPTVGPGLLTGLGNTGGTGKETITSGGSSNGNNLNSGQKINLSPVNYFFASASVLYVADSGDPKNDSNNDTNCNGTANLGDGGLQKWVNSLSNGTGTWTLVYTLYQGLNLVNNCGTSGTSGLYGLAGAVSGGVVNLYATNYTLNDFDYTYLYGVTDTLSNTMPPGTSLSFTLLDTAPPDSNFKGVSFVPTIPNGDVEVTTAPSGLTFTSSGTGCAPGTYTSPITLTWTPGSTCTLSVVTPQSSGSAQYTFSDWENGSTSTTRVVTAPSTTATYTANFVESQTISVTNAPPPSAAYGSSFTVAATASSNLAVAITTSGSCSGSGNNSASISMISGTGTCSVIFSQAGDSSYSAAPTITDPASATQGTTSISVTSVSPASEDYGNTAPVTITAVLSWSGSGSAPTASVVVIGGNGPSSYGVTSCGAASGNAMTCTNTYTPSTADTPGSYSESAAFPGDGNYSASSSTQSNNFAVNSASSATSVSCNPNPSAYGASVTCTATINGEFGQIRKHNGVKSNTVAGSVVWSANTGCATTSVTSGNPGTASCTTSILPEGSDTVMATYSGDSNHAGSSGSTGEVINVAVTTISVTSVSPSSEDYGANMPITITAVLSWTGSGTAPTAGAVAISGNGPSGYGTTSCAAASGNNITCTNTYTPTAMDAAGSYTESASFSGDGNYSSSSSSQTSNFAINQATSTTSVMSGLSPSTYGQSVTFTATINGENNLVKGRKGNVKRLDLSGSVTWSGNTGCGTTAVTSGNPGTATCTTSNLGAGTDTVTASYSGDSNHGGSTGSFNQSVNQASQTITFTTNAPMSAVYNSSFGVAATGGASNSLVVFSNGGGCTNVGGTYTMTSGTTACSVIANQAGNSNYLAAPEVTQSTNATKASQSITVSTPAPTTATNGSSFTVVATAGTPVAFTSAGKCTNSAGTYTINAGSGTCTETMNAAANSDYTAAPQVTESTTVAKPITPTVSFTGAPAAAAYATTFTVSASSNSTSVPSFTTTGPCTLNSSTLAVSMTSGVGTCTMTATWAANDVYAKATATQKTTAQKAVSQISWANPDAISYGTPLGSGQLNAQVSNTTGSFVYTPAAGKVLAVGLQSLSVRFTPASTSDYTTVTADQTLTVNAANTTTAITSTSPANPIAGQKVTIDFTVSNTTISYPTGSVTVSDGMGDSCTGNLSHGAGSCKIAFTSAGAKTVTASYPGNANNNGSASGPATITVGQ